MKIKKIAAFATTSVLLVAVGTGAASAREPRPGDHRGGDDATVQVVEAPETEAAEVEAPETDAADVEAPEAPEAP
jgi:hypothetical protein